MKDFLLHKLTLRVVYIIGAFVTSHLVSIIAAPEFQAFLPSIGVVVTITDKNLLQNWITGVLLIGGEFVYRAIHTRFILPHVTPK